MKNIAMGLVALAAVSFVLAVVTVAVTGPMAGVSAEGFSRASTNLALIAIGLMVLSPSNDQGGSS